MSRPDAKRKGKETVRKKKIAVDEFFRLAVEKENKIHLLGGWKDNCGFEQSPF